MPDRSLGVAFDTSSDMAGVALIDNGVLLAEHTWLTNRQHSRELLPAMDALLAQHNLTKDHIGAFFVCTGPGSYAGLRVGVSTAKALAYALDAALAGVGRLEADALGVARQASGRIVPVHAAGRAELAWAVYRPAASLLDELEPPQLGPLQSLLDTLHPGDLVCAELPTLQPEVAAALSAAGKLVDVTPNRVAAVAKIGAARWAAGSVESADSLVPLYLRAPAIGPQN